MSDISDSEDYSDNNIKDNDEILSNCDNHKFVSNKESHFSTEEKGKNAK